MAITASPTTTKFKHIIQYAFLISLVTACAETETPRTSPAQISKLALSEVPQSVRELVNTTRPDFTMNEVIKKIRDGRVYYDVEGLLANGDEIEFDVLMRDDGPEIVEIQRDLEWDTVPENARAIVNEANADSLEIVRIIESIQTDNSIIYEIFVASQPSEPRFEVLTKDGNVELLPSRWKH